MQPTYLPTYAIVAMRKSNLHAAGVVVISGVGKNVTAVHLTSVKSLSAIEEAGKDQQS